ncbi:MAG: FecR domain-containing protein [Exilibacterium sp.]
MGEMDLETSEPKGYYSTGVEDQAVRWFKKMSDKVVLDSDREAFQQWLQADSSHRVAYEDLTAFWNNPLFEIALRDKKDELSSVARSTQPTSIGSIDRAAAYHGRSCKGASFRDRAGKQPANIFNITTIVAMAASFLFAAFVLVTDVMEPGEVRKKLYATEVGESRNVTLDDGSTVLLNTDTQLLVAFSDENRKIILSRGEAFFDVVKDGRPFQVEGGTGLVTVLGTAFDVRVKPTEMVVAVERGRVAVSPRKKPLQQQEITAQDLLSVTNSRLGHVTSQAGAIADWRDGWLEFHDEALAQVIIELDRYYKGRLSLAGVDGSALRVTGRFHISDILQAIEFLADLMKLEISTSEEGHITFYSPYEVNQITEVEPTQIN